MSEDRQHAHELIDKLPEAQLSALVGLLETIVDPVAAALDSAALYDEPETGQEQQAVAESREWLKRNDKGIPHDEAMRSLASTPKCAQSRDHRERSKLLFAPDVNRPRCPGPRGQFRPSATYSAIESPCFSTMYQSQRLHSCGHAANECFHVAPTASDRVCRDRHH